MSAPHLASDGIVQACPEEILCTAERTATHRRQEPPRRFRPSHPVNNISGKRNPGGPIVLPIAEICGPQETATGVECDDECIRLVCSGADQ
jgi:hypothetical protein